MRLITVVVAQYRRLLTGLLQDAAGFEETGRAYLSSFAQKLAITGAVCKLYLRLDRCSANFGGQCMISEGSRVRKPKNKILILGFQTEKYILDAH